jgi:hypothetical protein
MLGGDDFSFADAIGGWRGLIESALPGFVYVVVFLFTRTWLAPSIAALAVIAVLVTIRLFQHGSLHQSLSGVVGVVIGVIWAWQSGNASNYFALGVWANVGTLTLVVISLIVRWPAAGVVMGLVHGTGAEWRKDRDQFRRAMWGTAVLASMFALRVVIQLPLLLAERTALLGTVKLVMGTPLFALTLWVTWLLVRSVARKPEPEDQPQQT